MKRQVSIPFLLLLVLTFGFRILQLEADPPPDFSWSGGYFADEGFWSHNARNDVLFGSPVGDEWDARIVSPVFARIQHWIFLLFGPGFAQVRLIAVISSLIVAGASFSLFRTQFDPEASFLFSILASLNYPMMVLGRQGILDPFASAVCLLALVLLMRGSPLTVFFAGVLLVVACVTKYLMVYAIVPFVYVLWLSKKYVPFVAGVLSSALVWFFLNYLPHKELLSAYSAYYASQQSWELSDVLKNIVTQPFYLYFVKTPAVLCLANLAIWFFVALLVVGRASVPASGQGRPPHTAGVSKLEKTVFLWLVTGILFFALWKYRPFRYYTSLIPPMAAMATLALFRLNDVADAMKSVMSRVLIYAGLLLPVFQLGFVLLDRWAGWNIVPSELGIDSLDAALLILLSLVVMWSVSAGRSKVKYAGWAFVAVLLLSDLRNYLTWMVKPQYNAVEISSDLERRAPNGVITGQWAPELCLENNLRVIPVWRGFVNSQDPFRKFGITHILQWKYPPGGEKFEEWYPEDFKKFRFITKYRIKDSDLILHERRIP